MVAITTIPRLMWLAIFEVARERSWREVPARGILLAYVSVCRTWLGAKEDPRKINEGRSVMVL